MLFYLYLPHFLKLLQSQLMKYPFIYFSSFPSKTAIAKLRKANGYLRTSFAHYLIKYSIRLYTREKDYYRLWNLEYRVNLERRYAVKHWNANTGLAAVVKYSLKYTEAEVWKCVRYLLKRKYATRSWKLTRWNFNNQLWCTFGEQFPFNIKFGVVMKLRFIRIGKSTMISYTLKLKFILLDKFRVYSRTLTRSYTKLY